MRHRQRGSQLGLLMLASQMFQMGPDRIPPVTLAVLALNVYLYLVPAAPALRACLSVQEAYRSGDWRRLILSPYHHVDDWHLYFNMASFLWKGVRLENQLGSGWFFYLLSVFSLLTGVVYLLLQAALAELTLDPIYSMQCALGFSGVLFALKVLSNHYQPGSVTYILGVPVSNRYASWVELVLIHLTSPGTSFVGHLAGILVGLLYTAGPLRRIMTSCAGFVSSHGYSFRQSSYNSSGFSGYRDYNAGVGGDWRYSGHNSSQQFSAGLGGMTEEEMLAAAIRNSLNDQGPHRPPNAPPPYGFHFSDEEAIAAEVRRRRLRRFDR